MSNFIACEACGKWIKPTVSNPENMCEACWRKDPSHKLDIFDSDEIEGTDPDADFNY